MKKLMEVLAVVLIASLFAAVVPAAAQQKMSADQLKAFCRTKADEAFKASKETDKSKRREMRKRCIESGGKNL